MSIEPIRHPDTTQVRALLARRAIAAGLAPAMQAHDVPDEVIEQLLEQEVRTPQPTEEECSRYYAVHQDEFVSGALVAARHILFAITPGAPTALIRAQAERVLQEVVAEPATFEACAQRDSNCPSGAHGGHLGQLSRGQCVPEFEHALFDESMALGILPRLVNTRFGFHIVAIDQRVPGQLLPYEAVREQIARQLLARVQETALLQYVRVLAGNEGIELPGIEAATSPLVQ